MAMLHYHELFFARVDRFESDFEGMYSNPNLIANVIEIKTDRDMHDLDIDNPPGLAKMDRFLF